MKQLFIKEADKTILNRSKEYYKNDKERLRERERDRETERQRDRQRDRQREREKNKWQNMVEIDIGICRKKTNKN